MVNIKESVKYRLLNLQSATYLSLSAVDNVSIVGNQFTGAIGQEWFFVPAGPGLYIIKSAGSDQYVTVPSDSVVEGQQLADDPSPFVWKVLDVDNMNTSARLTPKANAELFIDLFGGLASDETRVQLWPLKGNNQIWIVEEVR